MCGLRVCSGLEEVLGDTGAVDAELFIGKSSCLSALTSLCDPVPSVNLRLF